MAANDDKVLSVQSFSPPPIPAAATTASPAKASARFSETLIGRLGTLLVKAIEDATSLEVRTFTSSSADAPLASTGDPISQSLRLRAYSHIALDGDTKICVPVTEAGHPDETLWKIHSDVVTQARADRAATIELAVSAVEKLGKALR